MKGASCPEGYGAYLKADTFSTLGQGVGDAEERMQGSGAGDRWDSAQKIVQQARGLRITGLGVMEASDCRNSVQSIARKIVHAPVRVASEQGASVEQFGHGICLVKQSRHDADRQG